MIYDHVQRRLFGDEGIQEKFEGIEKKCARQKCIETGARLNRGLRKMTI